MPVYLPRQQTLTTRLAQPHQALVVCFCAAWCDTCRRYQSEFARLADATPQHVFVWADIEDHPELLGDADVEDFPTLLVIEGEKIRFCGPMLPHIGHLRRLLETCGTQAGPAAAAVVATALPDDLVALLAGHANRPS